MKEYIEREAALQELSLNCKGCPEGDCECCWVKASKNHIKEVPAVDVAPVVHGEWIKTSYPEVHRCSICDKPSNTSKGLHEYCPECGTKMDGGK